MRVTGSAVLLPGSSISADASRRGAAPPAAGADLHRALLVLGSYSADAATERVNTDESLRQQAQHPLACPGSSQGHHSVPPGALHSVLHKDPICAAEGSARLSPQLC